MDPRTALTGITIFWSVLGLAAVASCLAWSPVLSRTPGGFGLALVPALLAVGAVLPVTGWGPAAAYGSALLGGGTFLSVVTAVTAIARRTLPPYRWDAAIGGLTVAFALGQCAGPVLAGVLSDRFGGVGAGLLLSAALLVVALAQPRRTAPVPVAVDARVGRPS